MTDDTGTKRERQLAREEAESRAQRRAARSRALVSVVGVVLIGAVVLAVVLLMGDEVSDPGADGGEVATTGEVTVEGMPRSAPLQPGEQVPSFTAPGLTGGTVVWDDYVGDPAVLTVWAAWCPHCQAELPVLDRVMEDYPDTGLVSVVTAMGAQPGPTPEEYMQENGLEFPVAVDDANGTLATGLGVTGFPTLYFVDRDGAVALELGGEVDEQTLRAVLDQLS